MSAGITVVGNPQEIFQYVAEVKRSVLPKLIGRSLDETMRATRKVVDQTIRQRLNLKSRVVKDSLKATRSREIGSLAAVTHQRAYFQIESYGSPIPLKDYGARAVKRGVTFKVAKGAKRKTYVRQGRAGFISEKLGGHVFVRTEPDPPGLAKARIKKVFGPSLPQYLVTSIVRKAADDVAYSKWPEVVARNANFYLRVQGRR